MNGGHGTTGPDGKKRCSDLDESEGGGGGGHALDPALRRTGRLFGGLVSDIRRKAPWYKACFRDLEDCYCF
jgi:hypothetical protein